MAFTKERLRGILKAKGRDETDLAAAFGKARAHSWVVGTRKPCADDVGFHLAAWCEVPVDYLYGHAPHLDALTYEEAAAACSLDVYRKRYRDSIPHELDQLYGSFAGSSAAPRTVDRWRALSTDILEPAFQFAVERQAGLERMKRRSTGETRERHK